MHVRILMPYFRATLISSVLGLPMLALSGCGADEPYTQGAPLGDQDTDTVFNVLMQRPDIDQASAHYEKMDNEIRQALTQRIPELSDWITYSEGSASGCGSNYPNIGFDGRSRSLDGRGVRGDLSDDKYEEALKIIGGVAQRYGFNPTPQRLYDSARGHDAVFHKPSDEGEISFGTGRNTSVRTSIGCHLTADAKKRGHPSES